ncbi:hypothetical protein ES707_09459 [subsurface metagenome]
MNTKNLKVLDLFCGSGGFSKGFEQAGFKISTGIDVDPNIIKTYSENHRKSKFVQHDISKRILDFDIDVIIGSPPCQSYSSARGNWNYSKSQKAQIMLPVSFCKWVIKTLPQVALMENVAGFKSHYSNTAEKVKKLLSEEFFLTEVLLQSSNFGVPQSRIRYFLLAFRKDLDIKPSIPDKNQHSNKFIINDAFHGLDSPDIVFNGITNGMGNKILKNHCNTFRKIINSSKIQRTTNHIAKLPTKDSKNIVDLIPQGKAYRSDRLGEKYIGIWEIAELFKKKYNRELLSIQEQKIMKKIAHLRIKPKVKTRKGENQEGYVPILYLKEFSRDLIQKLVDKDWLKHDKTRSAVDFTAKAGHWRRYYRLDSSMIAPTLLTAFANARMFIHPFENRGLSLREGARLQTFPDDFTFYGSFTSISHQIGNAVNILE